MTVDEDPAISSAAPGDGEPTATRPPRVLAAGHLHPWVLGLRFFDSLRQMVLPVAISILAKQPWLAVASAVIALVGLLVAIARYLTFRYVLDEHELSTREGILHRQERRIPVDRIQDMSFESTLVRRALGLVVVSVETASGQGVEARLDSLGRRDAELLRAALIALRTGVDSTALGASVRKPPDERPLLRVDFGMLVLLGITSNRAGAIVLALLGAVELADELGFLGRVVGTFGTAASGLFERGGPIVMLTLLAFVLLIVVLGAVLSVVASLLRWGDFTLARRDEVLTLRHGLLTRRAHSLPRRRIQRVLLEANPLRRLVNAVVVRADSAGSGANEAETARSARDVLVPLVSIRAAEALVPSLLEGLPHARPRWRRVSSRLILRLTSEAAIESLLAIAIAWPFLGAWSCIALLLIPLSFGHGTLLYQNLGFARLPGHVAVRFGLLSRTLAFVPIRKVQGVVLTAGPIDRVFGLCRITIYVAGGSPTQLAHLPREEAEQLRNLVVREAAAAAFVW